MTNDINTDGKTIIHIALACDDNYAFYCAETIVSILVNEKNDNIFYHFYILQDKLLDINKERILKLKDTVKDCTIEFIDIDTSETEALKLATCYRLKLASLLPNLDKIIYTDCDVTFLDGLEEIWNEDIEDYDSGNCVDWGYDQERIREHFLEECNLSEEDIDVDSYDFLFNAGFMIMNLKKIREDNVEQLMLDFSKKYPNLPLYDQDIMNLTTNSKIKPISFKWSFLISYYLNKSNKIKITDEQLLEELKYSAKHPKMMHFLANKKPTTIYKSIFHPFSYRIVNKYKMKFWDYVALTDWKDEKTYEVVYKFPFGFLNKKK